LSVTSLFCPLISPPLSPPYSILQSRRSSSSLINTSQSPFISRSSPFTCSNTFTRLNSTLSLRIEELNAQISALHVENLRLRASEISLGSQLKKEKEKSQRIITDAESAVSPNFHRFFRSHFISRPYRDHFISPRPLLLNSFVLSFSSFLLPWNCWPGSELYLPRLPFTRGYPFRLRIFYIIICSVLFGPFPEAHSLGRLIARH
jgi:hypothetical protein